MASLYPVDSLDGVAVGDPVSLDGAEGRHAVSVARVRVGEVLGSPTAGAPWSLVR